MRRGERGRERCVERHGTSAGQDGHVVLLVLFNVAAHNNAMLGHQAESAAVHAADAFKCIIDNLKTVMLVFLGQTARRCTVDGVLINCRLVDALTGVE